LVGYPVGFPGFAPIGGKRLLEVRRIRRGAGPNEPGIDRSAFVDLLVIEFASAVAKLSDHGIRFEDSIGGVGPVNAPLMGLGVVKAQGQTLDMYLLLRVVDNHFLDLAATVQDFPTDRSPIEFHPFVGAGQAPHKPFQVEFPRANGEVKIVLPIPFVGDALSRKRSVPRRHSFSHENKRGSNETKDEQGFVKSHFVFLSVEWNALV
jgi:hypothetical protein